MSEFKKVYDYLKANDRRYSSAFEKLILNLLYNYLKKAGKSLDTSAKLYGSRFFDAIAPDGLLNTDVATIIDITILSFRSPTSVKLWLKNRKNSFRSLPVKTDYLIITPTEFTKEQIKNHLKVINATYPDVKFFLWGFNEIEPIFREFVEFIGDPFLQPIVSKIAFKNIVSKSIDKKDWRAQNDNLILKISEAYQSDDLVVFIGAGVSRSAGLPDWNALLSGLLVSLIKKNLPADLDLSDSDRSVFVSSLQKLNESTPLMEARYINAGLRDDFISEVTANLYPKNAILTSDLIQAIANLSIPPRGGLGVKALITYNFDDLIEMALDSIKIKYRPVYKDGDFPARSELGVFHVHGFLPRNEQQYEGISESLLVFSEENYHVLMQEPYNWSNLIQLNYLRENTCVLVGLSGTDPNLRRILELAKRKTKISKHYILLKRTPSSFFENEFSLQKVEQTDSLIESINTIHHSLIEKSFGDLGVNVIWFEKFDEIPSIINSIKK